MPSVAPTSAHTTPSVPAIHDAHGTLTWWTETKGYGVLRPDADTAAQVGGKLFYSPQTMYGGQMSPDPAFGSTVPHDVHIAASAFSNWHDAMRELDGAKVLFDARLVRHGEMAPTYAIENIRVLAEAAAATAR